MLTSCVTAEMRPTLPVYSNERERYFDSFGSIEIVARREMNATTVQLGIQLDPTNNSQSPQKFIVELVLQGNEWRLKTAGYF